MELFGIALSVPVAFAASALYVALLNQLVTRHALLRFLFRAGSALVLSGFAVEVALLAALGAVRSRELLGPAFYLAHSAVFFLGTPALANLLALRPHPGKLGRWYAVAPLCAAFALVLVLLQYGVSEALYGVDGTSGPFGTSR